MSKRNDQFWFSAKTYGVGWGFPVTWQGWLVLLTYLLLVGIGGFVLIKKPSLILVFVAYVVLLSGVLIFICWNKGERIEFRWGKKEKIN